MNFNIGNTGEAKVFTLYDSLGFKSEFNPGKTLAEKREYDISSIMSCGTEFKTEVKYDVKSLVTKNIAIELYNTKSGHDSGINATKGNIWAQISDKIYICKVEKLKNFVDTVKPWKMFNNAGDNNALIYLYKADVILTEVFTSIEEFEKDEAIKLIKEMI